MEGEYRMKSGQLTLNSMSKTLKSEGGQRTGERDRGQYRGDEGGVR